MRYLLAQCAVEDVAAQLTCSGQGERRLEAVPDDRWYPRGVHLGRSQSQRSDLVMLSTSSSDDDGALAASVQEGLAKTRTNCPAAEGVSDPLAAARGLHHSLYHRLGQVAFLKENVQVCPLFDS